ncbi:hypothetical protein [Mycobacterium sp. MS1601]|nr:hypothetical protein [Mycobacterium sp. MS1601]
MVTMKILDSIKRIIAADTYIRRREETAKDSEPRVLPRETGQGPQPTLGP